MAYGVQVMKVLDAIPVRRAEIKTDNPLVIRISGDDFRSVSDVLVNKSPVKSFTVVDSRTIDLTLTEDQEANAIQSLDAISETFTATDISKLDFKMGATVRRIEGTLKLLQRFVKLLLTTPGSNIFNRGEGGGLLDLIGSFVNPKDPGGLSGPIMTALDRTKSQLIASQAARRLRLDEKLLDAQILNMWFDRNTGSVQLRIGISTMAGTSATAQIGSLDG